MQLANTKTTPSILIVDDSEDSRSYCEMIADMFNVEVLQAHDVDEAMGILGAGVAPDVVLLDLIMPGRHPQELVKRVKADGNLEGTKVVVMSALRDVTKKGKKMGADASLHKPFSMDRFVNVVGLKDLTN